VSLYFQDVHSPKATDWMRRRAEPLPFTPLHRHEFRNAIRLAVWRRQMNSAERRKIFHLVDADLKEGLLTHQSLKWTDAFRETERIGETVTEQTGVRSADLLHIGIAYFLEAEEFLTFDAAQRKAATMAGFKCWPLEGAA
jgi:hypothetical protein